MDQPRGHLATPGGIDEIEQNWVLEEALSEVVVLLAVHGEGLASHCLCVADPRTHFWGLEDLEITAR